jgi:hypothetical protein
MLERTPAGNFVAICSHDDCAFVLTLKGFSRLEAWQEITAHVQGHEQADE